MNCNVKYEDFDEWKDVVGYEGFYLVNKFGNIYSLKTNKILKCSYTKDGYPIYNLSKNGKNYIITAHRAVALAFIPNPNNLPIINHKDEDKGNPYFENLEWCDFRYNTMYGGNPSGKKVLELYGKTLYVYDCEFNFIGQYFGLSRYCKANNMGRGNVSQAAIKNSMKPDDIIISYGKVFTYTDFTEDEIKRYKSKDNVNHKRKVCCKQKCCAIKNNSIYKIYESMSEAAEHHNTTVQAIYNTASGRNKSCKGYVWKYFDDVDPKLIEEYYSRENQNPDLTNN